MVIQGLQFSAAALAVLLVIDLSANARELSEQEQLDLLEEADEYYRSRERENARAIELYEAVLDHVDLAEPIRQEILFNVGGMYLYDRVKLDDRGRVLSGSFPSTDDLVKAVEIYEQLIEVSPRYEWRAVQAHMYLGDSWRRLKEYDVAAEYYLAVRELVGTAPAEKREAFRFPNVDETALRNLVEMYERQVPDGVNALEELAKSRPGDTALADAARQAAADANAKKEFKTLLADLREADPSIQKNQEVAEVQALPVSDTDLAPTAQAPATVAPQRHFNLFTASMIASVLIMVVATVYLVAARVRSDR